MNSSAEEALRAAVHELAGEARAVPDLAAGALRRGRRVRAHRRAMVVAVSVLAVAAMILPFVLLRHRPPVLPAVPEPTVSATPGPDLLPTPGRDWTTSPLVLPGGWVVGSALRDGTGWVLDRSRNRYQRAAGYAGVWPAPRGAFSALVDANRPLEIGLGDTARGRTTWIRVGPGVGPLQWSPDGRRLVVTISDKDTGGRFIGVLSTDGGFRRYPVDTVRYFCTDHCFFTWTRDGREVALQQTDAFAPRSESARHPRRGVQLFSADDGRPTRFVAVPGDPVGPWAWSPDGRLVVVQGQAEPLLVETATGRVLRALPTADTVFVSDDRLLYRRPYGYRDYVLADPTGRELARQPVPREVATLDLSATPR
ncbi:hypothetical protein OG559_11895 [Micromonospora sp. NBC_01405]|uniref:hypothetical protein n=1 Tax=Micromonospora sp. NBC_01405 TaxID=2903589 RepID=UPI0032453483